MDVLPAVPTTVDNFLVTVAAQSQPLTFIADRSGTYTYARSRPYVAVRTTAQSSACPGAAWVGNEFGGPGEICADLDMIAVLALLVCATSTPTVDGGVLDATTAEGAPSTTSAFDLRWSQVTEPAAGPARAIGQPGAGCLQGAQALPLRGAGWTVVHPERNRHYGHPTLIAFLRRLAAQLRQEKLPRLFVGDLGQPAGGPTPTGHRSHQNGLDVDLWYKPPGRPWKPGKSPAPPAPSVVDLRTKKLLPSWNANVARLVQIVAANPAIDRVFVHPAVKRALCQDKARRGPWLRSVRPWWGHQDHLHARLRCPDDSPDCTMREPLPEGDGCDKGLDWWFSDDAGKTAAKRKPPGQGAPAMPEPCERLLTGERR